ncbi:winged helix-turn-helix domain-containing protein [Vibrio maerlii]|uniref:winged helix-turn-helix domain-containing protein n=1 Tax=Vibrio maerlii TaxID=2231648 RepID=UPI000E3D325D|nr:winged helix-turn-helix domain-containing protein [Vibrio maerlii]
MLLINGTYVVDNQSGFIQSLSSNIRHSVGMNEILLLNYMMKHRGKVLSKQELMDEVWHKRGMMVENGSLLHSISSCRRGLEDRSGEIISTVRGVGYEFTGDVRHINSLAEVRTESSVTEESAPIDRSYRSSLLVEEVKANLAVIAAGVAGSLVLGFVWLFLF